ncbi:ketoacyl-synthetase C-terminal extension domain-containing protein [Streptomyces inhibens]|uniref:ketoacyl-synthetase C-terminal extension domain-containing protein n=1 Tax=Streptomyces inhibens TaxID=2293571 RepID=UPI0037B63549
MPPRPGPPRSRGAWAGTGCQVERARRPSRTSPTFACREGGRIHCPVQGSLRPFECEAIGEALGVRRRSGSPADQVGEEEPGTPLGRIGDRRSAEALLVLCHGMIPSSLHGTPPNPATGLAGWGLTPIPVAQPIVPVSGRAAVGVNSFGVGGSNSHVVLATASPLHRSTAPPLHRNVPGHRPSPECCPWWSRPVHRRPWPSTRGA